jgi:hypothetical protein
LFKQRQTEDRTDATLKEVGIGRKRIRRCCVIENNAFLLRRRSDNAPREFWQAIS